MQSISQKYGFTLLELLIVIIIVGVLTAVALPMYKHATIKSRFSKVMPVAKAVADAQEVYYLGKNMYALEKEELDVTPNTDTHIDLATEDQESQYNYVAASRSDVPGARYIMYQNHSANYPGEIHCEADKNNKEAKWLCEKGLHGKQIGGALTSGYFTYVLDGTGNGVSYGFACSGSEGGTCTMIDNKTKKICYEEGYTYNSSPTATGTAPAGCKYVTLNDDGTRTERVSCSEVNGVQQCQRSFTYDEDNHFIESASCSRYAQDGSCTFYRDKKIYDPVTGEETSEIFRKCSTFDAQGNCETYRDGQDTYYTYDPVTGQLTNIRSRSCGTYDAQGNCETYDGGVDQYITYDPVTGGRTHRDEYRCSTLDAQGNCTRYERIKENSFNPQTNGITKAVDKQCNTFDSENAALCTSWTTTVTNYDGAAYVTQVGSPQTCTYVAGADNNTADANGNCLE